MAAPTLAWIGTNAADASTGTHSPTYPVSGVQAGDAIYVVNVNKDGSGSADPGDPTPAAGWTKIGSGFGGTGVAGVGTGPIHVTVWRRNTNADGTENGTSTNIALDNPGSGTGRVGFAQVFGVRPAAGGALSEGWATGQDTTIGTAYSAAMGTNPGIAVDDLAIALAGLDNQTTTSFSSESITATGATFGTVAEDDDAGTSAGNDIRYVIWHAACTAGPASAAATIAGTSAGNVSGVGALLRIREVSGHNVDVLQASETDTAQPLGRAKASTLGQPAETDTAGQVTPSKSRALVVALETDTAGVLAVRPFKIPVNQALEADTATALGRAKARIVGQALESDTGGLLGRSKTLVIGQALETDSSTILGRSKARSVNQAAETDTAQPVTRSKQRTVGQAAESDTAGAIALGGVHNIAVSQAVETDTAQPVSKAKLRALVQAVELDIALTLLRRKALVIGQAEELDTAQPVGKSGGVILGPWTQPAGTIASAVPAGMVLVGRRSTITPVVVSGGAGSPKPGRMTDATPRGVIDNLRG